MMTWTELAGIGLDRTLAMQAVGEAVSLSDHRILVTAEGVSLIGGGYR
jgi:hypothetical protein